MPLSSNDRSKASKLRNAAKLTPSQRAWLQRYDEQATAAKVRKAKAMPSGSDYAPTSTRPELHRPAVGQTRPNPGHSLELVPTSTLPPREQLALPAIHETQRIDDNVPAEQFTFTPNVPPAGDDGDAPPTPGAPPPPTPGAPLVDEQAQAEGQGDPAAALQFAALVTFITQLGLDAAMELLPPVEHLPPMLAPLRVMLASEKLHAKMLDEVAKAAERIAIRRNWQAVPMADEVIVGGSVAGSVLALYLATMRAMEGNKPAERIAEAKLDERKAPTVDTGGTPLKDVW